MDDRGERLLNALNPETRQNLESLVNDVFIPKEDSTLMTWVDEGHKPKPTTYSDETYNMYRDLTEDMEHKVESFCRAEQMSTEDKVEEVIDIARTMMQGIEQARELARKEKEPRFAALAKKQLSLIARLKKVLGKWEARSRYEQHVQEVNRASIETEYAGLAEQFGRMGDYKDAKKFADECKSKKDVLASTRKEQENHKLYEQYVQEMSRASTESEYYKLAKQFRAMGEYKDATKLASNCDSHLNSLRNTRNEQERIDRERSEKAAISKKEAAKARDKILLLLQIAIFAAFIYMLFGTDMLNSMVWGL